MVIPLSRNLIEPVVAGVPFTVSVATTVTGVRFVAVVLLAVRDIWVGY
jgi:hypothetical protein